MPGPLQLQGQRFGNLVVTHLELIAPGKGRKWRCICDCGVELVVESGRLRSGNRTSCGCRNKNRIRQEDLAPLGNGWFVNLEYFESLIYPDPNSGCFIFDGSEQARGHCSFIVRQGERWKTDYAHRIAWMLAGRRITKGASVRHLCNTPCCVNVDHLALGTPGDNNADTAIAERHRTGMYPRGVTMNKGGRFRGRVPQDGKLIPVGTFDTVEEAAEAVRVARAQMFKDRGIKLLYPVP